MSFADSDLIARVLANDDRNAFGELVRRYQSDVRQFLRRLTRDDAARADDLAQETFVKAYRSLRQFHGDAKFSSWLYRIAHRSFLNDLRKRRESLSVEGDFDHLPAPGKNPSVAMAVDVRQALKQLSVEEQAVFDLHYRKGMTHAETSAVLELPLGTVKTHLSRGKEKLKSLLKDWKRHDNR